MVATNAQLDARLKKVEAWKLTAEARIGKLETAPAGTDYSTAIDALWDAVNALKLLTCPEAPRLDAIDAALALLQADHLPEA